eukprot:1159566-Pelagomonas_calceolata.AAC.22
MAFSSSLGMLLACFGLERGSQWEASAVLLVHLSLGRNGLAGQTRNQIMALGEPPPGLQLVRQHTGRGCRRSYELEVGKGDEGGKEVG